MQNSPVQPLEIWQVEAGGKIYSAAFEDLPEWISEGSLLPGDKIRKGDLRWVEAGKVASLSPFFAAKAGRASGDIDAAGHIRNDNRAAAQGIAAFGSFGLSDLRCAFAHPFRFRTSLIVGSMMFMLFTIGRSAGAIGGMATSVGVIFCLLLANMLSFGILANTVENFSRGALESDFMPSFDDFELWDTVIHPFILSIGVYLVSFGPLVLLVIIGSSLLSGSITEQNEIYQRQLKQIPGTEYYAPNNTAEQSDEVKRLLGNVSEDNKKRLALQEQIAGGVQLNLDSSPIPAEAIREKTTPQPSGDRRSIFNSFVAVPAPLVILGLISLVWGLFYFPAACVVAGYSRSFRETIDPTVGLDTIRRLGSIYAGLAAMWIALLFTALIIETVLETVLFPLELAGVGNLPAIAIGSIFNFYFSIVFSCLIGYAIFKAGGRLKLYK